MAKLPFFTSGSDAQNDQKDESFSELGPEGGEIRRISLNFTICLICQITVSTLFPVSHFCFWKYPSLSLLLIVLQVTWSCLFLVAGSSIYSEEFIEYLIWWNMSTQTRPIPAFNWLGLIWFSLSLGFVFACTIGWGSIWIGWCAWSISYPNLGVITHKQRWPVFENNLTSYKINRFELRNVLK